MATSQATVPTENGASYLRRLCKHWSHRFESELEEAFGRVNFGEGKLVEFRAEPSTLGIVITAEAEALDKLEDVVASHLVRFATKESLAFEWIRSGEGDSR